MHVEGQNDEMLDSLLGKVKILKDITVGIGDEVRASNMELGNMVRISGPQRWSPPSMWSKKGRRAKVTERRVRRDVQLSQWDV